MGILTYAKLIAGTAGLAVVAWGAATVNGWRVEAKTSRPTIAIQAEKIVEQDRQIRGYEALVKDLKARDALKERVIVTVRERGEDLARRLTALNADLARIEAERVAWQARPYVGTCDEMVREFARRGGAKP